MLLADFQDYACIDRKSNLNMFRWFLREALARKASSNIWGQGFSFYSQNKQAEKVFKEFDYDNKLLNLFSFVEKYCSLYGRAIITINKTEGGKLMLQLNNPFYFTGVGKVFATPQLAVVYHRVQLDNQSYVVKSTYTTKDVKNEVYAPDNYKMLIFDKEAEVLKELKLKKYWKHNLGFVPVVEITNLPFYQQEFNNWNYVTVTDWYPAFGWERTLYIAKKNFEKELTLNHSRLVFENADQGLINTMRTEEYEDTGLDIGDYFITTENGATTKVQPSNADFAKFTQAINSILDFYFKFAGISKFSEGGGAQKTVAETSTIRSQLIESINQKINLRTHQMSHLIMLVLKASGIKDPQDFIFKINGNILKDETTYIDNIIKKIQAGLISPIDAIQDLFNVNQTEAQAQWDRVKAFNEANDIMLGFEGLINEGEQDEKINNLGEHPQDPDKQGKA